MNICDEKRRLLRGYQEATRIYSDAVTELNARIARSSRTEYEGLRRAVEDARTNIDETAKVVKPIAIMATTHPASSPALGRLRTVWPPQTLMQRSCSSLSTLPPLVLAELFEVPGYVLSCESFPCAEGHCARCPHFFATLLPSQLIRV